MASNSGVGEFEPTSTWPGKMQAAISDASDGMGVEASSHLITAPDPEVGETTQAAANRSFDFDKTTVRSFEDHIDKAAKTPIGRPLLHRKDLRNTP